MRKLHPYRYPAIAFALGLASALGFAPLNWWLITLLCVAGLMWLVMDVRRLRDVAFRGWAFGVGHFTFGNSWIATAFTFQDSMPHWFGAVAVFLAALYLAIFPMFAAMLAWALHRLPIALQLRDHHAREAARRRKLKSLVPEGMEAAPIAIAVVDPSPFGFIPLFAGSWIVTEYLRSIVFTGFAWNPLGAIMVAPGSAEPAWMGLTRLIGTYGLSGWIVLLSGIWVLAFLPGTRRVRWQRVGWALLVAMLAQILSAWMLRPLPPRADLPQIRVIQPNINQNEKWDPKLQLANFRRLTELSGKPAAVPRLILWPEAATSDFLELEPEARRRLAAILGPKDKLLLGGDALIFDKGGNLIAARNSLFGLDAGGRIFGRYDKAHLVPYGEYLPMRSILSAIGLSRLVPGDMDFWPGQGPASLAVPGFGKAGVQICYEIIFSGQVIDAASRPDFLFNPSNDAWFGRWGPPQHLAQARLRAAEEGMPIIRSTPTGISAVIDADGRLLHSLPWKTAGAIESVLPAPHPPTLFSRFGNLLPLLFAALLLAGGIGVTMRAARR